MIKKITILFILLVFVSINYLLGQKQNSIWCFGANSGVNFNTIPISTFHTQMTAIEGCASIADANGSLLFYTNGLTVWDKSHTVMSNGTGLAGGSSSAQGAIIIPSPSFSNLFYIFTNEDFSSDGDLSYSIVDINLNNGMGDVVIEEKNVLISEFTEECLTTVLHANGKDIWIITHRRNSNEYLAFLLSGTGLNFVPTVSPIGTPFTTSHISTMKASHSGQKIISAQRNAGVLEMFDFNTTTGELMNPININQFFKEQHGFYGLEFSANDSMLYLASTASRLLSQVDLNTQKVTTLNISSSDDYGAIQLGPDHKIYVARLGSTALDIIHDPDQSGLSCNYEELGLQLESETMSLGGLPNLVPYASLYTGDENPSLGEDFKICSDHSEEVAVQFPENCFGISFVWNDGSTQPVLAISEPGLYWVRITSTCGVYTDTLKVDTLYCFPIVHYDFEACRSFMNDNSHMDYSEFTPVYPNTLSCAVVTASNAYRSPSQENKHSCTPGVNESVAMCISADTNCTYSLGNNGALFIDVFITLPLVHIFNITAIQFFQKAPKNYSWISGPSGLNNPPSRLCLRILKNGQEILRKENIETTEDWSIVSFQFTNDELFALTDTGNYRFEFFPYCPIGLDTDISVWDIDEFQITGTCDTLVDNISIISGTIQTVSNLPMANVEVLLSPDSTFNTYMSTKSDVFGNYSFEMDFNNDLYFLKARHDLDFLHGLEIDDLILIQKHLLGIKLFEKFHEYISSDLDRNGKLSVYDLVLLKKLLLGKLNSITGNTSWRIGVLKADTNESDLSIFIETYKFHFVKNTNPRIDFLGIKIGDTNGNAQKD